MKPKAVRPAPAGPDEPPVATAASPEGLDWLRCSACRADLRRHQPDPLAPCRLLGTCEGCGHWYLILVNAESTAALMMAVPVDGSFRHAWEERGGPDGAVAGPPHGGPPASGPAMPTGEGWVLISSPGAGPPHVR